MPDLDHLILQLLRRFPEWQHRGSFRETLVRVCRVTATKLRCSRCEVYLPSVADQPLVYQASPDREAAGNAVLRPLLLQVAAYSGRQRTDDVGKILGEWAVAAHPIRFEERILGSMGVARARRHQFTGDEFRFLSTVTVLIGILAALADMRRQTDECGSTVQNQAREIESLRHQLLHSGKLSAVGQLAAGIAHELNSPLGAIVAAAQCLLLIGSPGIDNPSDTVPVPDLASHILVAARRCQEIAQGLLDYSRGTAVELVSLNLNEVIEATLSLIGHLLKRDQIRIVTELGVIQPIRGSRGDLIQLATNLILNARDAILGRKKLVRQGTITVRTVPGQKVLLVVEDDGCGIPIALIGRIFDPFFTTKEPGSGTGLGLAIARTIVERHMGEIQVTSKVNLGTTVRVAFPPLGSPRPSQPNAREAPPGSNNPHGAER